MIKYFTPQKEIIELPAQVFHMREEKIRELIGNSDIYIVGGGFLRSLWIDAENDVRKILKMFSDNKIVILPQTIYFEDNDFGKKELQKSKKVYNQHKNLTICVREKMSMELLESEFPSVTSILTPDSVLFLEEQKREIISSRSGILLCMRSDKEGILTEKNKQYIINMAKRYSSELKQTDTVCNKMVTFREREEYLQAKFKEFEEVEMVITDRLHGMIFAAITGTPCFVLSNSNYKVKGVYEWIKELEYIHFSENLEELSEWIPKLLKQKECRFYNDNLRKYFLKLKTIIEK